MNPDADSNGARDFPAASCGAAMELNEGKYDSSMLYDRKQPNNICVAVDFVLVKHR